MSHPRLLPHTLFLFLLPLAVALFDLSLAIAMALVALALLWRWGVALSIPTVPDRQPELVLRTIAVSHFVEKVRWCMDRLGLDYAEQRSAGTLGAFFTGRTVPQLWFRAGLGRSSIGNSPEILRYLWGRYAVSHGRAAAFLEPTAGRIELERTVDRCGTDLQVWVYFHLLPDRPLTLQAWGVSDPSTPAWQRAVLRVLYPLLAALIRRLFRLSDVQYQKSVARIEAMLADAETRLADGRTSLLGDTEPNYSDLAFAAINGLWLQPANFGGGAAECVLIPRDRLPALMREDIDRWTRQFPRTAAFIDNLYRQRGLARGIPAALAARDDPPGGG